jgi:LPS O-antigen subunit length determinant protein (WzzB/FepE family)
MQPYEAILVLEFLVVGLVFGALFVLVSYRRAQMAAQETAIIKDSEQ